MSYTSEASCFVSPSGKDYTYTLKIQVSLLSTIGTFKAHTIEKWFFWNSCYCNCYLSQ